jgi:hypothetical protein
MPSRSLSSYSVFVTPCEWPPTERTPSPEHWHHKPQQKGRNGMTAHLSRLIFHGNICTPRALWVVARENALPTTAPGFPCLVPSLLLALCCPHTPSWSDCHPSLREGTSPPLWDIVGFACPFSSPSVQEATCGRAGRKREWALGFCSIAQHSAALMRPLPWHTIHSHARIWSTSGPSCVRSIRRRRSALS